MKKRLISILLAICLVVTFFGTTTQVSACEEGNDVLVDEEATLNRNVQAWSINSEEMQQLNKGCEVYVYTKYPDGGKWLCIVSFGRYGRYIDVPMDALIFDKDVASENKPEQDSNGSDDHVSEYATLLRNVPAWSRDRGKAEQLNKGCIVKILKKVKENGKYSYTVSFGRYGEFEGVPQDALSFEEDAPTASKPQEDSKNDKPNPEAEYAITTRIVFAVCEETGEVKQFNKGCRVKVLERTFEGGKNLCRISFGKYGKYKGMPQDALSFEDDAPSNDNHKEESSTNKVTTNKDGIVRVATYLNGRSSPTWGNNIISRLKPNEMVEVLEISADKQWNLCKRSNGEKVWCYAHYIERGTWTKVLSKSSTSTGSSDNRLHNIALACRQLNGKPVILFPGDVFSWREWMGPSNASEGYKLANVITRAGVVLGYGGGVCQVSTTMNKAAKALGIETDAKKHFGNGVSYAEKEDEATVSYAGGVDFSFTNSTKDIIRLKMSADGETCTCTVYKLVRK